MKNAMAAGLALFLAAASVNVAQAQTPSQGPTSQTATAARQMAREGEKVWVIINHIKPDKREQFEKFIHETFWPMANKLSTEEQRLFRQTRVLHPTKAEADGTYSYIFLMDPLVEGANYEIEAMLIKMYGEQQGKAHSRTLDETFARNPTDYLVTQSRY